MTIIKNTASTMLGGAVALLFFALGAIAVADNDNPPPHCPLEDSCTIDYRNGGWYIDDQRMTP